MTIILFSVVGIILVVLGILIFYKNVSNNIIKQSGVDEPKDNFFVGIIASSSLFAIGIAALITCFVLFIISVVKD